MGACTWWGEYILKLPPFVFDNRTVKVVNGSLDLVYYSICNSFTMDSIGNFSDYLLN